MFCHRRAWPLLAAALLTFAAACSSSPTAPSSTTPTSPTGQAADGSSSGAQDERDAPSGSSPAPPAATSGPLGATRFVALGDSITWGILSSFDGAFLFDAGPTQSYPFLLQAALNANHGPQVFTVENRGVPAERAEQGASRIHGVLSELRPQGLLLLEGVNDMGGAGTSVSETVGYLQTMLDIARLHNVTVFIANMFQTIPVDGPNGHRGNAADQIPAFNAAIAQMVSGRQNVYLVDLHHAFQGGSGLLGNDGLHPTPAGYERIAAWFRGTIEQAFAVRSGFQ